MDGPIKASIDWVQALEINRRWLATVVHARLADHQAAEDVLQEVALATLRQTSKPTDPTKVAPWLYRIALRKVINHHRSTGRRRKLSDGFRIGIQCIQVDDGDDKAEAEPGLEVKTVFDDSPAKKAGIEKGDILVSVNGIKISKIVDLTNALQEAGKNEKEVAIEVKRDKKNVSVTVKPTKMKASDIELENIQLSLPTGGFAFSADNVKLFHDLLQMEGPGHPNGTHVLKLQSNSVELKKDIDELKSELADLKKMIKELVDKK